VAPIVHLGCRQLVEDRVGHHERAGKADGMRERHTQPLRLHGQPRRGEAPPWDQPTSTRSSGWSTRSRAKCIESSRSGAGPAVVGVGIPVGSDHTQTVSSNQLGKRSY